MPFYPDEYFHIYNQGNNRQQIFFDNDNYLFFLEKVRRFIAPTVDILAYCLMPNHFHFLVRTNTKSCQMCKVGSLEIQALSNGFRNLQSSYAQAINKRYGRSGSLFRQKTKMKLLKDENHIITCFHYIHQDPINAGLVERAEQWSHSSFSEYFDGKSNLVCSQGVMKAMIGSGDSFYTETCKAVDQNLVRQLYQASDGS